MGCKSKLESGSTFWFTLKLPLVENKMRKDKIEQSKPTTTPATITTVKEEEQDSFPNAKVLLVEDNMINQKVGVRLLESFKCQVQVAANGKECLSILKVNHHHEEEKEKEKKEKFDLVLMDCQMPEMDGFEATARIREWERSAAVFYDDDDEDEEDSSSSSNTNIKKKKKKNRGRGRLPIVALTASATEEYKRKCLECGMDDFLAKVNI